MRGSRPGVHAVGDSIEFVLAEQAQVCALGHVLAQQAVRVSIPLYFSPVGGAAEILDWLDLQSEALSVLDRAE